MINKVSDDDFLKQLMEPENDRAWKMAVGHTLGGLLEQATVTNGRISRLERFMFSLMGGLVVIAAIVVPLFLSLIEG